MSLIEKMMKAGSKNNGSSVLSDAAFFSNTEYVPTPLPILNIAFGGSLLGGLSPGLTLMIGQSKTFKSALSLLCMKAYLDAYPDAIAVFYDNEFGVTPKYIKNFGIDPDRVVHIPAQHVEHIKFDMVKKLEALGKNDKVFFFLDSLGMLASKKEVEDAIDEKSVADMSRAKAIKSMFRLITPRLNLQRIPCIMVNHTYESMGMFAQTINSGGQGATLSPNNIFNITKAQEKVGTELKGWQFTINIFKSRTVREKAKFPFTVYYESGINKYSGLLDIAIESGHVLKGTKGKSLGFQKVNMETGEIDEKNHYEKETNTAEFWDSILACPKFNKFIEQKYMIANDESYSSIDAVDEVMDSLEEDE